MLHLDASTAFSGSRSITHRARSRRTVLIALTSTSLVLSAATAQADPNPPETPTQQQVFEAKTQLASITHKSEDIDAALDAAEARLTEMARKAGTAAEKANEAQVELTKKVDATAAAQRLVEAANTDVDTAKNRLDTLAAHTWMSGGSLDGLEVLLNSKGSRSVADRVAGYESLANYRGTILGDARLASKRAADARRQAAVAQLQQEAATKTAQEAMAAAKTELESATKARDKIMSRRTELLAQLATARRTSVDLENQRRLGLASAAAQAAAASSAAHYTPTGQVPAPNPRAATAIAYARAQLGKTYVWGGEGPDGYDCSGLTKMAWAAAGKRLTHQTNWQWRETVKVPLAAARPGDLIFYGQVRGDIHHVGLYLGGGKMIHAPTYGEPVKISSIYWGDLIGYAGRVA